MTPLLQQVEPRILSIVSPVYVNGRIVPRTLNGTGEIRQFVAELNQMQKRLRALKGELRTEMKSIRLAFSANRANPNPHPFMALFLGKKHAIHQTALDRERSRQAERAQLAPYEAGLNAVDTFINLIEEAKLEVSRQVVRQRTQG